MEEICFQLQDVEEMETREKLHTLNLNMHFDNPAPPQNPQRNRSSGFKPNGFVVQGGPWEQSAPNTASVTDFPAFGRSTEQPQAAPVAGAWGNRR